LENKARKFSTFLKIIDMGDSLEQLDYTFIIKVSYYLSLPDIISFGMVSRRMKRILNSEIWKYLFAYIKNNNKRVFLPKKKNDKMVLLRNLVNFSGDFGSDEGRESERITMLQSDDYPNVGSFVHVINTRKGSKEGTHLSKQIFHGKFKLGEKSCPLRDPLGNKILPGNYLILIREKSYQWTYSSDSGRGGNKKVETLVNADPLEVYFRFKEKKDKTVLHIQIGQKELPKNIRTKNILGRNSFTGEDSSLFYADIFSMYKHFIDEELYLLRPRSNVVSRSSSLLN